MSRFFAGILDLIFPPRCVFCGAILSKGGLCDQCQPLLPWLTEGTAEQTLEFCSLCVSPLRYEGAVRKSIHRYKFRGMRGYAEIYGGLVADCIRDHLAGRYDLISWVPLSKKHLRTRGYDQAFLLANAAARSLGTAPQPTLRKARNTAAQSGLTEDSARRANVMGAYEVPNPALIAGKRVLLIDDVVTTGSTLTECARVLRTAGAADVICATLSRAR
ncbi:MAG: ComF family protein [Pseudoflavonifractor sp.]